MEAKRTARRRLRRYELKFEVVDDAVYGPELLDEGHDLHPAAEEKFRLSRRREIR
jgi:hypothetical protein